MTTIPLAYKFVVTMAMLSQVNYYGPRLHLPFDVPVGEKNIKILNVSHPFIFKNSIDNKDVLVYGGQIQITNYSFSFEDQTHLIFNLADDGLQSFGFPMKPGESARSGLERASRMKYTISTNDVYRMATNWLVAFDIDVQKLEKSRPPCIDKEAIYHSESGPVRNPLSTVEWAKTNTMGYDPTEIEVKISAVSGELLRLNDGDGSFTKRRQPLILGLDKLIAIPDAEFEKYSTLERSNLLVNYAGIHCSDMHCPGIDKPLSVKTNVVSHLNQNTNSTTKGP